MKTVRIYKDDIRVNILRSLFFTDTTLALTGALAVGGVVYFFFHYVLHFFIWGYFVSSLVISEIFFLGLVTQKIDNQPIYKIVPRGVTHKATGKKYRQPELDPYFTEFYIQDNLIVRKNSIIRVYRIEPYDIALLNDEDREHFFIKLKQMIHVLPSQVQFIVRKEEAKATDYSQYFFSLYEGSEDKRENLIEQHIEDISELVSANRFLTVKYYSVFSATGNPTKPKSKVKAIKKLNDMEVRFLSALHACQINAHTLSNDELISFAKSTLR